MQLRSNEISRGRPLKCDKNKMIISLVFIDHITCFYVFSLNYNFPINNHLNKFKKMVLMGLFRTVDPDLHSFSLRIQKGTFVN